MALSEQEEFELLSLEREKSRFGSTPGGAALGNPNIESQGANRPIARESSAAAQLSNIASAGGMGAAMGAAAPEMLTAAGAAAGAFPLTAPASGPLMSLGRSAKLMGRVPSALSGAFGGVVGETAGQAAEAIGTGPVVAEGARVVGGMAGPGVGDLGMWGVKKYLATPSLSFFSKVRKEVLKKILGKVEGDPALLTGNEKKLFSELNTQLRGGPKSDRELETIFDSLDEGAHVARATAAKEADSILATAETSARSELSQATKGNVANRMTTIPRLEQIGADAIEAAKAKRIAIAPERELSDIGSDLRGVIVKRNETAIAARRGQFEADETERNAIVQAKEAAGDYMEKMPEYVKLRQSIQDQLLSNKRARMKTGTLPVGDKGTVSAYQNILDAVSSKRIMVSQDEAAEATAAGFKVVQGTNPATGEPASYRQFATSFDALDDVRRKLGTVFTRQPAEGYEAIGADIARRYYGQISEIQKNYAGGKDGPQARLLQHYADSSEGLEMFRSKTGKAATALDKFNDGEFATDAGKLPSRYFSSPEGIKALTELTGSKELVASSAKEYAVRQLADMNEKQVRSWMTDNRELLRAVPDLYKDVSKYADDLGKGERISGLTKRHADYLRSAIGERTATSEAAATKIRSTGEKAAGAVKAEAEKKAALLVGDRFPIDRVRKLIESGNRTEWEVAAPAIAASPQARASVAGAVRQVISERAEKSVAGLATFFERNVRPAVEKSGLMSAQEANEIAARINALQQLKMPEKEKVKLAHRLIIQSVGSYSGTVAGRLAVSAFDKITGADTVPQ